MNSNYSIKGTALDTRIQHSILTDAVLQADLTAEEFRAFINLMVWVVSQVSDGLFNPDRARIVTNLSQEHLCRFLEVGLLDQHSADYFCITPAYWGWQTSRADLERQADNRRKAAEAKAVQRRNSKQPQADSSMLSENRPVPEWAGV